MKPEHLKLAGIVTVVCGSMFSFEAGAAISDAPAIATGPATMTQSAMQSDNAPPAAVTNAGDSVSHADELAAATSRTDDADPEWASADLVAVTESKLDDMRGGFDLPSGLLVSFGISRAAFVNGNLVAQTSFNIPDIANMTAQQAQALASANTGALIQVGPHNTVQQGALPGLTGALIQNTLSGQQIQALTTINTSVNSLGAFKAMNFLSTLNSALTSAVRPR
jgi:hypothetical protein